MAKTPSNAPQGSALERLPPVAKVGVGAAFVALIAVLYFVVFYGELDTQIEAARTKESALATELEKAKQSKADYQKDQDEKTRREQLAREQKKVLPDDPETPAFLNALQGVATISGINLTSWSPIDEAPFEFYAKVPMKLTMTGKFHQIVKFFHGVGQLDRIINIENIQFKSPKLEGEEVSVEVECLATAFRSLKTGESGGGGGRKKAGGAK